MPVEVKVPSPGESINEVFIGTWLKNEGDTVELDEPLVEVETDKATLEVPAPVAGTVTKLLKSEGDTANVGEVIAHIEEGEAGAEAPEEAKEAADEEGADVEGADVEGADVEGADEGDEAQADGEAEADADAEDDAEDDADAADKDAAATEKPHVMPAARRLLEEQGISSDDIEGSGKDGRILKEDVERYLESSASEAKRAASDEGAAEKEKGQDERQPSGRPDVSGDRQEESVRMSPLRRRIAERLVEAQQTGALLTTFNEIDMSAAMALRSEFKESFEDEYGTRLGFMSFFVKASIDALKRFPQINAEIRDDQIVYKNYYDIGVAVSTKRGLIVPVIRNAEQLSFAEIEETIRDFGSRAGENKLAPDELQGGTFTITNGGVFGSLMSTPIVNPPQSGVLGMHSIQDRPVAVDGEVVIRPMMYVALTYDHRIVDGREAVTFLKRIKETVENPARILLEI